MPKAFATPGHVALWLVAKTWQGRKRAQTASHQLLLSLYYIIESAHVRALYFLHFSAAYLIFSEGFTIFWSFQGMEGANCIGYCTCVPVLAGLLLNRQSCCADADISFNMLHVSSCALAFHLFSQNKLR